MWQNASGIACTGGCRSLAAKKSWRTPTRFVSELVQPFKTELVDELLSLMTPCDPRRVVRHVSRHVSRQAVSSASSTAADATLALRLAERTASVFALVDAELQQALIDVPPALREKVLRRSFRRGASGYCG